MKILEKLSTNRKTPVLSTSATGIPNLRSQISELRSRQNEQTESHNNNDDQTNNSSIEKRDQADDIDRTPNQSTDSTYDMGTTFAPNNHISHHHQSTNHIPNHDLISSQTPNKFWKVVRDDNLDPHCFQSLIKDITLQDDSMHGLCHFYNKNCHVTHTSFKKHIDILPPFGKLVTIQNIIKLLVLDNPAYVDCTTIRSVSEWIAIQSLI